MKGISDHDREAVESAGTTRRAALRTIGRGGAAAALVAGVAGSVRGASAQDAESVHPIVGSWVFAGTTGPAEAINAFTSDGVAHISGRKGNGHGAGVGFGSWEEVDASTVATTYVIGTALDDGTPVTITVRGTLTVDETGDNLTADGLFQVRLIDGTVIFVVPSQATGVRIKVEPPEATEMPAGGGFPAGTPPATPAG